MPTLQVIAAALEDGEVGRLVARRDALAVARGLLRIAPPHPQLRGRAYWPIWLVTGTATFKLPFRQPRDARLEGAVDGMTGRCGVVDVNLPPVESRDCGDVVVIPERLDADAAGARWREFFRNYLWRRFRPAAIPRLEIADIRPCHLPYRVVVDGRGVYLVDELMRRVDPLDQMPEVARFFADVARRGALDLPTRDADRKGRST